jgi:hypothetical protein
MSTVQLFLTTAGSAAVPIRIPVALYGKYKVVITGFQLDSNHANQQAVQIQSRHFVLPFAGGGSIGADQNQSVRYPTIIISGTTAAQGANSRPNTIFPITLFTDFDGVIELNLVDIVDQVAARFVCAVLTFTAEPVSTVQADQHEYATQQLSHTFTQVPARTYYK